MIASEEEGESMGIGELPAPPPSESSTPRRSTIKAKGASISKSISKSISIPARSDESCERILALDVLTSREWLYQLDEFLSSGETEERGFELVTIWNSYLKSSPSGLYFSDTPIMSQILTRVAFDFHAIPYAKELIDLICAHLKLGIRMTRSDRDIKPLVYTLTVLGEAICSTDSHFQTRVLDTLSLWLEKTGSDKVPNPDSRPIQKAFLVQALESSKMPRALGSYLKDGSFSEGYCSLLKFLRQACDSSPVIRSRLCALPMLDPLLLKLCLDDPDNKILGRTLHLLLSMLGRDEDNSSQMIGPQEGTFQILLTRLFVQLKPFSSKAELGLRNDTGLLLCFLTNKIPEVAKLYGRYAQAIAAITSTNVFGSMDGLQVSYWLDSTLEDTILLKYFVSILGMIIESGTSLKIIDEFQLVPGLLAIEMGPSRLIDAMSAVTSIEALQCTTWSALLNIAKHCPDAFLVPEGAKVMLDYLRVYNLPESCTSPQLLSMFLHLLCTMLSCPTDPIIAYFKQHGAMSVFVTAVIRTTAKNCNPSEEKILSCLLLCCSVLGNWGMDQKEEFLNQEGVRVVTRLMRQLLFHPANERHMDPILHVAIAECIWKCVGDSPSCLELFLWEEGMLRMLDLLEMGAGTPATTHILTCILELCEYPRCMDQILGWVQRQRPQRIVFGDDFKNPTDSDGNGKSDRSFGALLCSLWQREEKNWGVERDPDGCISNIEHPLLSEFGRSFNQSPRSNLIPGPVCLDMVGSIRPKIFLLTQKITKTLNTEAQLFDGLGLRNQITMQIIVNFLDLKRGEIWFEMGRQLENEAIVDSDALGLSLLLEISRNKVLTVLDTQRYLIQRDKEREEIGETEFYKLLQSCHLQDHLKAMREVDYQARTSNYLYLVEKRLWQKVQLMMAMINAPPGQIFRTTSDPLNITAWPLKVKKVDAKPYYKKEDAGVPEEETRPGTGLQFELPEGDISEDEEEEDYDGEEEETMEVVVKHEDGSGDASLRRSMTSDLLRVPVEEEDHPWRHNMSMMTGFEGATPISAETGHYEVSPDALKRALQQLAIKFKKNNWLNNAEDNNYWRVRARWKQEWYPEEKFFVPMFESVYTIK